MRGRRHVGAAVGDGLLERGQVDERLEHRSRLAARRDHAVVLRLVVGPAADKREDFAGLRIDGDERRFGKALTLAPRQQLVDLGQAVADRVLRQALQVEVERRVHVDGLGGRGRQAGILLGRASGRRSRRSTAPRPRARAATTASGSRAARSAASSSMKPASAIASRTTFRRSFERAGLLNGDRADGDLNDAGNRRRFGQREIADVLAEEQTRGFGDAEDGERPALAERDIVQVHLEDLVLRRANGEDDREEQFEGFASERPGPRGYERHALELRQEDVPNQLLRDRAAAGHAGATAGHIGEERAADANRIHAGMLVEPPILDREHGLRHVRRESPTARRPGASRARRSRAPSAPARRAQAVDGLAAKVEVQHTVRRPRGRRRSAGRGACSGWRKSLEDHANDLAAELGAPRHDR